MYPLLLKQHNIKVLMLRELPQKTLQHFPSATYGLPHATGLALPATCVPVLAGTKKDTQDRAPGNHT